MKTLFKVPCDYTIIEGYMPAKEDMVQGMIYVSEDYGLAIHLCLCGTCGIQTVMPLNKDGKTSGWNYEIKDGKISFSPSIGNYSFPCKSHYIITNSVANFV